MNDPQAGLSGDHEWLRVTLASIGDAVIATDVDGRVRFMNEPAETLTGWPPADAFGQRLEDVFQIVNEDTRRQVENPAVRALREGIVVGLANHTLLIARDGTERPIDDSAAPIRRSDGTVAGVVLVFRDVTERREAERALRFSEQRYRALVEGTRDYAIFMLDPDGTVATWNPGAQRLKGWSAEEVIGQNFSIFYPREALAEGWPAEELRRAVLEGRFEDEGWRVRKDGTRFWANVIITALHDDSGHLLGFSKITRDLTERRRAEEALREREERFHAVTRSASDAIVLADQSGRISGWNPAAERLFGYAEQEVLGRPLQMLMPERFRPIHEEGFARLLATGQSRLVGRLVELTALRRDGSEVAIELSLSTWVTDRGRTFCGIVRDLTERTQLQRAKVEAEVLADMDRRKDEFLAMLSHELRNPLAPILNAVHILADDGPTSPVQAQALAIVERQVGHLTRLVDDLLDVSRITTGRVRLLRTTCDLRRIVERAVDSVRPRTRGQDQALTSSTPVDAVWVHADATRLEQVVVNLVANAAKYTEKGGRIAVDLTQEGGEAVLRVRDTGVGIAPELLPHVFELFTQAERSLDRAQGGLGVGLTVVKRLVQMHAGSVSATSDGQGKGSEFEVRLPTVPPPAAAEPTGTAQPASSERTLRVLVVDDNRDAADSSALLLRHAGHEVRTAYSGGVVLDAAREFRPDAILLDIGLPEVDGYELARRLRADPSFAQTRLVAVTGYGRDFDRARSLEAGFDAHVVKPVDAREVLRLVGSE